MYTENPASSGADFTGAVIEPGIRSEDETTVQGKTAGQPVTPQPQAAPDTDQGQTTADPVPPDEPKRTAPPGAIIPTMGWPGFLYRLICGVGRPDLVPALSKKESAFVAKRDIERRRNLDREYKRAWLSAYFNSAGEKVFDPVTKKLVKLEWEAQTMVIAILTQKGGAGKTEDAVRLSRVFAKEIEPAVGPILMIPATRNPGSTTRKAGVSADDTLTLPEIEQLLKRLEEKAAEQASREVGTNKLGFAYIDADEITSKLRKNADGVYVIAQSQLPADFTAKRYAWVLSRLRRIFPLIIQDTGNNTAKRGEIEYEAALMSDVLVFVCNTGMEDSPELMGLTMDSYSILPKKELLSASVTVVNGLRADDSLDNWARYAEYKINEQGHITGIRDFPYRVTARNGMAPTGTLVGIPWDEAIVRRMGEPISQETSDAFLDLAVLLAKTKGKLAELDFAKLDQIRAVKQMVADFDPTLLSEQYPTPQEWIGAHAQGTPPTI